MTTRHGITYAEEVYVGNAFYAPYAATADGRRGLRFPQMFTKVYGAVLGLDTDIIDAAITATGADTTAVDFTADVPRNVTITSTGNNAGVTFTVVGTDEYGQAMTETITGPNNATVQGKKAFKTVTSISNSAAITADVDVGRGNIIGFPVVVPNAGYVLGVFVNGIPQTTLTVVGAVTTSPATATTGDVRGTWLPNTAPNGSNLYTVNVLVADNSSKEGAFGVTPA